MSHYISQGVSRMDSIIFFPVFFDVAQRNQITVLDAELNRLALKS